MTTSKQKLTASVSLIAAFALGAAAMYSMSGCSLFTSEKVAEIHKTVGTVLDIAYSTGGSALVEEKIDQMVADGKITSEQAAQLKAAAKKSYDALQTKLTELSVKDVTVEAAE